MNMLDASFNKLSMYHTPWINILALNITNVSLTVDVSGSINIGISTHVYVSRCVEIIQILLPW
jgi:hypothetical protein